MDDLLVEREQHNLNNAQWMNSTGNGGVLLFGGIMKLIHLSDKFYSDYANCKEILTKDSRPYACLAVEIDGKIFAIPLRHHINHEYAFITLPNRGLDYTKAVVISTPDYIADTKVWIDAADFARIKDREKDIVKGMSRYYRLYLKAAANANNRFYQNILRYSSLQYFIK